MKIRIMMALMLSTFSVSTIAADIYRWTDPDTGKVLTTPTLPPYPIKEKRSVGNLSIGELIDVILDDNAPEVKVFIDKHKAKKAEIERKENERAAQEAKRISVEQENERAAQGEKDKQEKDKRIAAEKEMIKAAIEKVRKEEEERPIREEMARVKAAQQEEGNRIAEEKWKKIEDEEREVRERAAIKHAEEIRVAAEEIQKIQQTITEAKSKKDKDKDINFMLNIIDEFEQYNKFASSTARINLAIPINNLVNTKVKLDTYPVSKCYASSKIQLQEWMNFIIKSYYSFSAQEEYQSTVDMMQAQIELKKFWLDFPPSCSLWNLW